jgi:tetratricopeptide (TPR) repeat protein
VLFDLRGKRRRVVQVVYATLAALFLVGFVGFSIGSDAPGGLFDAFGVGGSGDTGASLSSQYDDQIESANEQLAKDPKDTAALLKLSKYEFYKAKEGITQDEATGQPSVSEDAHTELGNAADAWEKYLKVNKDQPSATIATQMVQAYYYLGDAQGAADAQRIVAEDQPDSGGWDDLAYYLYLAGDISGGDKAADRAVAETPKAQRSQVRQELDQIRKEAVKLKKQQAKAQRNAPSTTTPGDNPLQNPFGGAGAAP